MGKGGYTGGHTKVGVTVDGTHWPEGTELNSSGDPVQRNHRVGKRWANDSIQAGRAEKIKHSPLPLPTRRMEQEFLARCAQAFHRRTISKTFPIAPLPIAVLISRAGDIADWINGDAKRRQGFDQMVSELEDRDRKRQNRK